MKNAASTDFKKGKRKLAAGRSRLRTAIVGAVVVCLALATGAYLLRRLRLSPELLFEQAQTAWSAGRLEQADAILARLARLRTPPVTERLLRAEIARQRGLLDQALSGLDGFSGTDAEAALIWRTRGMLEIERDRARPAESALLQALALNPALALARRDLISLYSLQSRQPELKAQFRALALATDLTFGDLYLWCVGRRLDAGPADLAAKLERMLRNDPSDRLTRLALVENLRRLGRLDDALATVRPLAINDPDVRAARARLALDSGAVDVAKSLLSEGPPDHSALARLRGRLALAQGDPGAIRHFRAALAGDSDDRDALFGLGRALRLAGKADAAQPYLRAARDRDQLELLVENARSLARREDPEVLRTIGDACRSLGRLDEARAWYRLALTHNPADSDLQKRLFDVNASIARASRVSGSPEANDKRQSLR